MVGKADYYKMGGDACMFLRGATVEMAMNMLHGARFNHIIHSEPHPGFPEHVLLTEERVPNPDFDEDAFRRGYEDAKDDLNDLLREDPRAFSGDMPADF